jgi:hypothetical protein
MRRALVVVLMVCSCGVGPLVAPQQAGSGPDAGDDAAAVVEPDAAANAGVDTTVASPSPDAGRDRAANLAGDLAAPELPPDAPLDVAADLAPDLGSDTAPCQPAECVAGQLGLVVRESERCPAGLGLLLGSNLSTPACTGCACGRAPAVCRGTLYAWPTDYGFDYVHYEECQAAPLGTGGSGVEIATGQPCDTIFAPLLDFESPTGFRMGPISIQQGICPPRGTATLPRATFQDNVWFCPVPVRPQGCPEGSQCLRAAGPRACLLLDGGATCPAGTVQRGGDWFEGVDDQRRCGACTCGPPEGASCEGVHAQIGNDIECNRPNQIELDPGEKVCLRGLAAPYAPGVILTGEPTRGTCAPASQTVGTAQGKGRHTLCCAP